MLSKDTLDRQITLELPARELMFFLGVGIRNNWAAALQTNAAANTNLGLVNAANIQANSQTNGVVQG